MWIRLCKLKSKKMVSNKIIEDYFIIFLDNIFMFFLTISVFMNIIEMMFLIMTGINMHTIHIW